MALIGFRSVLIFTLLGWKRYLCNLLDVSFWLGLRRTNIVMDIYRLSNFSGRGRPPVPLCALFQVQAGTWVEPPMFRKLAE